MSSEEFTDLCMWAEIVNDNFTVRDIDVSYNLAMMTRVDEVNKDQHLQMQFVEFLEAIARVADIAKHPEPWLDDEPRPEEEQHPELPLWKYIENIMPKLILLCPREIIDNFGWPETSPFYNNYAKRPR